MVILMIVLNCPSEIHYFYDNMYHHILVTKYMHIEFLQNMS